MPINNMIHVQDLKKAYNGVLVLDLPELEIPTGQSFGLVGNNGAGKTTFFSLLLDLIEPTRGFIKNNEVVVNLSEDWKTFTTAFLDERSEERRVGKECRYWRWVYHYIKKV